MSLRSLTDQIALELGEHAFLSVRQSNELRERGLAQQAVARAVSRKERAQ